MRYLVTLMAAVCLMLSNGYAEDNGELITVTATGLGSDSDTAIKNALKSAVEQAMGTLIDTKTMIENDLIIDDKILSYSGGFVKTHRITHGPEVMDGIVQVTIEAQVKRTQLLSTLETEKIVIQKVDGLSLGGESFTKSESKTSALQMTKALFDRYPGDYIYFESLGQPSLNDDGNKVVMKVKVGLDWDKCAALLGKFESLLEQTAIDVPRRHRTFAKLVNSANGYPVVQMTDFNLAKQLTPNSVFVLSRISEDRTLLQWRDYPVSEEFFDTVHAEARSHRPLLTVDLLDATGAVIDTQKMHLPWGNVYYPRQRTYFFIPFLVEHGSADDVLGPPSPVTYTFVFDKLFPDEIQEISEVKIYLQ